MKKIRSHGLLVLFIATLIMLINPLRITSFSILDTDPSTYIIVPMLMLLMFILFKGKEVIQTKSGKYDIALGIVLFAIFVLSWFYLKYFLSYKFISYRIDMLLFPIAIAALIIIIFGHEGIRRFRGMLFYALFASPLLLLPVFGINMQFAQFNTFLVYEVLHLFYQQVTYSAPLSLTYAGSSIGIGESCAGIGALIGIIMFLIPLAYFYDGRVINKVYWVISGFVLFLLLNVARMVSITAMWLIYGERATASYIHTFVGIWLFYITIIVMILIAYKYGLMFPKVKKRKAFVTKVEWGIYALALLLAASYFFISAGYVNSLYISPMILNNVTFSTNSSAFGSYINWLMHSPFRSGLEARTADGAVLTFSNKTFNVTDPIVLMLVGNMSIITSNDIIGSYTFAQNSGINLRLYSVVSNNTIFYVGYAKQPLVAQNGIDLAREFIVMPASAGTLNLSCGGYSTLYSYVFSTFDNTHANATEMKKIESAYCVTRHILAWQTTQT